MMERDAGVYVAWDEDFGRYDFGPGHPMHPMRLELTARLCEELGLFARDGVSVHGAGVAADQVLLSVHSADYLDAVRAADAARTADPDYRPGPELVRRYGIGTDDVPAFAGMHDASARLVQGSVLAAEAILGGEAGRAVNFGGGMHHAGRGRASGFCVYNDVAAAIARLLDGGIRRVAYIDTDAHHGDGVESIFWDDPRVLTVSLHETGRTLFPGTGFPGDIGGVGAEGSAVNVALPARCDDAGWLRAFDGVVPPLMRAFEPEVIVSQHGCDGHLDDPLTHLRLSVDAMRESALRIAGLADLHAGGRWLALGGGGYEILGVVPRVWSHLLAIASGRPIAAGEPVPESWREYAARRTGRVAPATMGDGVDPAFVPWSAGVDPHNELDRAVMATRRAVFGLHGLDPYYD
jgi:acetoin utilization protein AcuC